MSKDFQRQMRPVRKSRGSGTLKSRCSRGKRGTTLIETLIASLLSLVVGGALMMMVSTTYTSRSTVMGENAAFRDTRLCLDTLSNGLINAS